MISYQQRPLGVAPLTALDVTVEEYVSAAGEAGLELIGVRPHPVLDTDPEFPAVGSQRFTDLTRRIADNGLRVLDIEVYSVTPRSTREEWLPVIEAGQALGAKYLNIVGDHEDLVAFEELIAAITADATPAGITPILEPVAYRPLNSFERALEIAHRVGCKVELDVLHFMRTGATLELLREHPGMFPILQLCDAPRNIETIRDELLPLAASDSSLHLQVAESRAMRQLPGEGDAPIADLIAAAGPDAAISIEIPNARVRGDLGAAEYFTLLTNQARNYLAANLHTTPQENPRV